MTHKKINLDNKICLTCGKPFAWRKKWERCWNEVKFCSEKCRRNRIKSRRVNHSNQDYPDNSA